MMVPYDEQFSEKVEARAREIRTRDPKIIQADAVQMARMSLLQEKADEAYAKAEKEEDKPILGPYDTFKAWVSKFLYGY